MLPAPAGACAGLVRARVGAACSRLQPRRGTMAVQPGRRVPALGSRAARAARGRHAAWCRARATGASPPRHVVGAWGRARHCGSRSCLHRGSRPRRHRARAAGEATPADPRPRGRARVDSRAPRRREPPRAAEAEAEAAGLPGPRSRARGVAPSLAWLGTRALRAAPAWPRLPLAAPPGEAALWPPRRRARPHCGHRAPALAATGGPSPCAVARRAACAAGC